MLKAKNPRMPFPSFTLALSRQEAGDNESNLNNSIQERNASNVVELPVDLLMVSLWLLLNILLRLSHWDFFWGL